MFALKLRGPRFSGLVKPALISGSGPPKVQSLYCVSDGYFNIIAAAMARAKYGIL